MTARYFAGIDWSSQKHDLCIQDASGTVHLRLLIPHTAEGLGQLLRTLQRYAGGQVAIERPSGLLVDTLLEAGIPVFACNKRLRKALTCWANHSRRESAWAEEVYREAIQRGCSHPHALRILARAWVRVLWRCWRDRAPYESAKHGRAQALHSLPAAA